MHQHFNKYRKETSDSEKSNTEIRHVRDINDSNNKKHEANRHIKHTNKEVPDSGFRSQTQTKITLGSSKPAAIISSHLWKAVRLQC